MKFKFSCALLATLVAPVALAQVNPCSVLGIPNAQFDKSSASCIVRGSNERTDGSAVALMLAGQQVSELRALVAETQALRREMAAYQANLAQARAKYEVNAAAVSAAQEKWRVEALDATLLQVEGVPAKLALDQTLRDELAKRLKNDLAEDPSFLQALRAASPR